jgi:membrane associated rhomboid family serine protease
MLQCRLERPPKKGRCRKSEKHTSGNGSSPQVTDSESRIRDSITVQMSTALILVYLIFSAIGGNLFALNLGTPTVTLACPSWSGAASYLVQNSCLVMKGWIWMLFSSLFLHLNILHLGGNLLFLLIFGTALEEKISKQRWLVVFLASGISGNIAFLALGPLLGSDVGLGASGSIYGLLGAAGGVRGAFLVIILLGLNLFSGGGEVAHVAGLVTGLALHRWGDRLALALKGGC